MVLYFPCVSLINQLYHRLGSTAQAMVQCAAYVRSTFHHYKWPAYAIQLTCDIDQAARAAAAAGDRSAVAADTAGGGARQLGALPAGRRRAARQFAALADAGVQRGARPSLQPVT